MNTSSAHMNRQNALVHNPIHSIVYWMIFKVGETALHKSCRNAHHAIVKELLGYVKKHNTNLKVDTFVRTLNDKGETALHCAARIRKSNLHFPEEDRMIIKLLMESGSDVFIQTKEVQR